MVPTLSMVFMATSAIVSIGLPIALGIIWHKRTSAKASSLFIGAAAFVVFAMILENICHRLVLYGSGSCAAFMQSNLWAYGLYGALAAGVFEETGRLCAFKLLFKKKDDRCESVMYGIGHGGVEAVLVSGLTMISYIVLSVIINVSGGMAGLTALGMGESQTSALMAAFTETNPFMYLVSGIERTIAIAFHISMSVLVFAAVKQKGKGWYYPLAIGLHALLDMGAMAYQTGIIKSIIATEGYVLVFTALCVLLAVKVYRGMTPEPE
ncbi:MAG: YhfC family intramembrane metalloprotease [Christensenellales bacterium]